MNASPKEENSASQQLIDRLIPFLKGNEYGVLQVRQGLDEDLALKAAELSDAWIIVAPMYLSSLPSSMIALMDVLEAKICKKGIKVCGILQCGLYDPANTRMSMELIRLWCARNGYTYTGSVGIGAGACLNGLKKCPTGRYFLKALRPAYVSLVASLTSGEEKETFFSVGLPKWLYVYLAQRQWEKGILAQGLEKKDLAYQPKDTSENFSKNN